MGHDIGLALLDLGASILLDMAVEVVVRIRGGTSGQAGRQGVVDDILHCDGSSQSF